MQTGSLSRVDFLRLYMRIKQKNLFLFIQRTLLGLQNRGWKKQWFKASPHSRKEYTPVQQ